MTWQRASTTIRSIAACHCLWQRVSHATRCRARSGCGLLATSSVPCCSLQMTSLKVSSAAHRIVSLLTLSRIAAHSINSYFGRHEAHLKASHWQVSLASRIILPLGHPCLQGLPELCNENGSHCPDSCPTQVCVLLERPFGSLQCSSSSPNAPKAWSTGCILDVLYDMQAALQPRAPGSPRRSKKMALIQMGRRTSSIVED